MWVPPLANSHRMDGKHFDELLHPYMRCHDTGEDDEEKRHTCTEMYRTDMSIVKDAAARQMVPGEESKNDPESHLTREDGEQWRVRLLSDSRRDLLTSQRPRGA